MHKLFDSNIPLAISIAKSFIRQSNTRNIYLDDLFQEAYLALWQATQTFDESKKYKFSTYATSVITNSLLNFFEKRQNNPYENNSIIPMDLDASGASLPSKNGSDELIDKLFLQEILAKSNLTEINKKVMIDWIDGRTFNEMCSKYGGTPQNYHHMVDYIIDKIKKRNDL